MSRRVSLTPYLEKVRARVRAAPAPFQSRILDALSRLSDSELERVLATIANVATSAAPDRRVALVDVVLSRVVARLGLALGSVERRILSRVLLSIVE